MVDTAQKAKVYLLAWLAENGPDEWHRVACAWNWDYGCDILHWIIDQDNCDRGTALQIFWLAQPGFYLDFRNREDLASKHPPFVETYDLVMKVLSNWRAGRYRTAQFSTEKIEWMASWFARDEKKIGTEKLPWIVPEDMRCDIEGEQLSWSNYTEGYPPHLIEFFDENDIPY